MASAAEGLTAPNSTPTKAAGGTAHPNQRNTSSISSYLRLVPNSGETFSSELGQSTHNQVSLSSGNGNDAIIPEWKQEEQMADISKEELSALLRANKAEVDAVASAMKAEMSGWREQMRADLRDVKDAINSQKSSLDQHIIAQKTQLDAHMQIQKMLIEKEFSSQSLKIDTSIKLQTAGLQESLSAVKLDITRWVVGLILGVPSILFTLYKIIEAVSSH